MTLPIAPPRISASASGSSLSPRGARQIQTTSTTLTTRPSAMKNRRCQPEAPASMLKAAPVLCSSVKSSTGRTSTRSKSSKNRVTRNLVAWSSPITASDSHSHAAGCVRWKCACTGVSAPAGVARRGHLGVPPRLARAVDVRRRSARRARDARPRCRRPRACASSARTSSPATACTCSHRPSAPSPSAAHRGLGPRVAPDGRGPRR